MVRHCTFKYSDQATRLFPNGSARCKEWKKSLKLKDKYRAIHRLLKETPVSSMFHLKKQSSVLSLASLKKLKNDSKDTSCSSVNNTHLLEQPTKGVPDAVLETEKSKSDKSDERVSDVTLHLNTVPVCLEICGEKFIAVQCI